MKDFTGDRSQRSSFGSPVSVFGESLELRGASRKTRTEPRECFLHPPTPQRIPEPVATTPLCRDPADKVLMVQELSLIDSWVDAAFQKPLNFLLEAPDPSAESKSSPGLCAQARW